MEEIINKGNLTLCPKVLGKNKSIPMYEVSSKKVINVLLKDFISQEKEKDTVFVCFQNKRLEEDYREENSSILITHKKNQVLRFFNGILNSTDLFFDDNINKVDFSVFEFKDYKEAFIYCSELKEGL